MTSDTYDPDLNLQSFNDHGIFTLEELNQLSHVVKPQLSALHLNIRSLSKHFDELCHLLNSFPYQLDLFACSETWITPQVDISSLQISGYNIITGMIFLYLYVKRQLKNCLKEHYTTIILLSINHRHTDSRMLYVYIYICVCVRASLFPLSYIFHSI